MTEDFRGKVVLVTGASSGIGRATALAFASQGASVVVAARRFDEVSKTAAMIEAAGGKAVAAKVDVSQGDQVKELVAMTIETYGRLDHAFNNAGVEGTPFVPTADYSEETWDSVIDINLKGVWLCMKYEIPEMLKQGGGAIVNMSSVAGLRGGPVGAAYHASKHGVIGLTKAAAVEYAPLGIRVNAVAPAVVRTAMADRFMGGDPDSEARFTALHPLGRIGSPEEVAEAVLWLCSNAASFVTGHALPVDGGFLI